MTRLSFDGQNAKDGNQTAKSSIRSYAATVFKESSVGIVSSIAQTTSVKRKTFKILALILCLSGFLYQSGQFLQVVFYYPTSVHIEILRPEVFNIPAFTFCDNNGINRRIFCEKYPNRCEKPSKTFCKKYEDYCGENETLVPKRGHNTTIRLEEMTELNVNKEDFVQFHTYAKHPENFTGPHLRVTDYYSLPFICYSLYDRVNNSQYPRQETVKKIFRESINELKFKVRADEMFLPGNEAGILFAIHSQFQAVNPFDTGIFMKPGRIYKVLISMEEEILLEKPFATNCVNYTETWIKNGRAGPRIRDMCKEKCMAEVSMKCFNCVVPTLCFPTNERYCTAEEIGTLNYKCAEDLFKLWYQCDESCRDECSQTKYHYTVQERFMPKFDRFGKLHEDIENTITVQIFLEREEILVRKHIPKYMIVEVFSSIGGFIGCWMGFNLLDITDIFEGFFRVLLYSFKRYTILFKDCQTK